MAELSVRSLFVGFLASCALNAAPINLVQNPSFENNTVNPSLSQSLSYINGYAWQIFPAIDFWGLGYPSYGIELQKNNLYGVPSNSPNGPTFNAWDGNQWAELDYTLNGVGMGQSGVPQIYQDLSTIQGASYLL